MDNMVTMILENGETITLPVDKAQNMIGWKASTREEADKKITQSLINLKNFIKGNNGGTIPFTKEPYWRDSLGIIRCPGEEKCSEECDENCPIKISTDAGFFFQRMQIDKAITLMKKAVDLAPDYYDPWNNMGAAYGVLKNYDEAYKCYLEAHKIRNDKVPPVFGLAMSCCDMGKYEECIEWCNEYDRMTNEHKCDGVRDISLKALEKSLKSSRTDALQISANEDFLSSVYKVCDELQFLAGLFFAPLGKRKNMRYGISELVDYTAEVTECTAIKLEEAYWGQDVFTPPETVLEIAPLWSVYSGICAVFSWDKGFRSHNGTHLYESILEPLGPEELREYIADYLREDAKSDSYNKFQKNIVEFGERAFYICVKEFAEKHNLHPLLCGQIAVMYNIGLIIGEMMLGLDK